MGIVLARCTRCERLWRAIVYQARGKRLRNLRSSCCGARLRRSLKSAERRAGLERP